MEKYNKDTMLIHHWTERKIETDRQTDRHKNESQEIKEVGLSVRRKAVEKNNLEGFIYYSA